MSMTLSICSTPSMRSCSPATRPLSALFERASTAATSAKDVVDQRTLAGAADAGDADERAERELDVDVLEIVVPAPTIAERVTVAIDRSFAPHRASSLGIGDLDLALAREILAGDAALSRWRSSSAVPAPTTSPPRTPGPGPKSTM